MLFDFKTFTQLVTRVYDDSPYTLEQVLAVFRYYFEKYEGVIGHPHPNIRMEQIRRIVQKMPYISPMADIEPEEYRGLIDQHFETKYRGCDYNINHFFSGKIRELRFYETVY